MNQFTKLLIVFVVIALAVGVIVLKQVNRGDAPPQPQGTDDPPAAALPVMLELGSDICVPCKMMEPVIEELHEKYADQFEVQFINVRVITGAYEKYGITMIPTQIFFDADGEELFRHQGFFSKEQILAKWRELGYTFTSSEGDDS